MKFSINRELFLTNLNYVARALSTKPQMPILTGIKLEVKNDYIGLTASNSDITIQTRIPKSDKLVVDEEGVSVLPGKYLLEIIRKLDARVIDVMSYEENMVKILTERSNFTLNVLDKDTYPLITFEESDLNLTIDVLNLKQIIKKTTFVASVSESRMVLTGVNLSTNDNRMEAVATDSFRLAKKYMFFDKQHPSINVVIPAKSLDELNKIAEEIEEYVSIHFFPTKVLVKYKNLLFQTRLIEGVFPNTSSLVPTEFLTSIKFNKLALLSAIERASLFTSSETSNIIKMTLKSNGSVQISSTSNEIGATLEEVPPISLSNPIDFQVAFTSKYFIDALRAFDSPEISLHFTGEIKPFILTGEYDVNHIQLILPVRVS